MHLFMKRTVYIIPSGEMHLLFNVMDGWYWEQMNVWTSIVAPRQPVKIYLPL